jgi:hypothetical protein
MAVVHRVLSFISPRWRQPSPCEGCGEPFICGASLTGCWCMKVMVTSEARARLRQRYTKCICRACLERESNDIR